MKFNAQFVCGLFLREQFGNFSLGTDDIFLILLNLLDA
jgi:hypothetical protein